MQHGQTALVSSQLDLCSVHSPYMMCNLPKKVDNHNVGKVYERVHWWKQSYSTGRAWTILFPIVNSRVSCETGR